MKRFALFLAFAAALGWAQWSQPLAARLQLRTEPRMPARVYLFKDDRPFRLSPVDALMPLRADLFYRERLWRRAAAPAVLEVTAKDLSHFFLLSGAAGFDLPAGKYRIEAYRGLFYKPYREEFELQANQTREITLRMENWAGAAASEYLSGDDHIHLVRDREDDALFLQWLQAEDLNAGNFLQLQRQSDAAQQYGFGPQAEARSGRYSIRSGHESRSEFFGHINLLGGRELIRPLSIGSMYANSPELPVYPHVLFGLGKKVGATVGFAHFDGSMPHSTLLMDVALGALDFVEVFQFGVLKTEPWYALLNAGFRVHGIAGSDFPGSLTRTDPKTHSRAIPLLGPERYLVKAGGAGSAYEQWAAGIRRGEGLVTNGPLVELTVRGNELHAAAKFYRPLQSLEIVANGKVIARSSGTALTVQLSVVGPVWVAARASAGPDFPGAATEIQAHTNPVFLAWDGKPPLPEARRALAARWQAEMDYYRSAPALVFPTPAVREQFFADAAKALAVLSRE